VLEVAAEDEEDGVLSRWDAGWVAVECAAGTGGIGVVIDRRMLRGSGGGAGESGERLFAVTAAWVQDCELHGEGH